MTLFNLKFSVYKFWNLLRFLRFSNELLPIPYNPPRSDWKLDDGYDDSISDDEEEVYPLRVFSTGKQSSLIVLLRIFNSDVDALCGGETQGFKVIFHPP